MYTTDNQFLSYQDKVDNRWLTVVSFASHSLLHQIPAYFLDSLFSYYMCDEIDQLYDTEITFTADRYFEGEL